MAMVALEVALVMAATGMMASFAMIMMEVVLVAAMTTIIGCGSDGHIYCGLLR